jgi:predicted PurR-regulated permease PerM
MLRPKKACVDPLLKQAPARSGGPQALPIRPGARTIARGVLTFALIILALWTASDFLTPVGWAVIIAIAAWPVYAPVASHLSDRRHPIVPPLLFTVLVGLLLFVPIALTAHQLAQQSETIFSLMTQAREKGMAVPSWIGQLPIAADFLQQWWRDNLTEPQAAAGWFDRFNAEAAAEWIKALGGQLLHRTFMFLISLLALFMILRNAEWLAARTLQTAERVLGDPAERLAEKMVEAVRGSVNGTVAVALLEGMLIGVAYAIAGVPYWALFAVLTTMFAMLPFGAWIAFTVAAMALLLNSGSALAAALVFAWGALVMLVGDHFVWPTLVGGAARLPFLFALIGIFGGLQTFGLIGLFLGPVIMAALLTVWREWLLASEPPADAPASEQIQRKSD